MEDITLEKAAKMTKEEWDKLDYKTKRSVYIKYLIRDGLSGGGRYDNELIFDPDKQNF